jgi:hypothetical protein
MSTRIHAKVRTTIAGAAMVAAVVAPCASADSARGTRVQIPPALSHLQEPGSTGWVPEGASPQPSAGDLARGDALNKRYHLGKYSTVAADGFDWDAAGIGAGVALGLALVSAGALMAAHKRRALAHV